MSEIDERGKLLATVDRTEWDNKWTVEICERDVHKCLEYVSYAGETLPYEEFFDVQQWCRENDLIQDYDDSTVGLTRRGKKLYEDLSARLAG